MNIQQVLKDFNTLKELAVSRAIIETENNYNQEVIISKNSLYEDKIDVDDTELTVYLTNNFNECYIVNFSIKDLELSNEEFEKHIQKLKEEKEIKQKFVKALLENQQKEKDLKELERLTNLYKIQDEK